MVSSEDARNNEESESLVEAAQTEEASIRQIHDTDAPFDLGEGDGRVRPLDRAIERALRGFGQSVSRRSFLSKLGAAVLGGVGVAFGTMVLPIDRTTAEATHTCSSWYHCGLYGRACGCCNGYKLCKCPDGAWPGNYWAYNCCKPSTGQLWRIAYVDCCNTSCSCTWCQNHPQPQPYWDCSATSYACTTPCLVSVVGSC